MDNGAQPGPTVEIVPYEPAGHQEPWPTVVRPLRVDDVDAVAGLLAQRSGRPPDQASEIVAGWLGGLRRMVFVAEHDQQVEGYGKAEWLDPAARGGNAPAGWYLAGLTVAPAARRHGLGLRLTRARLEALALWAAEVWYVGNCGNRATVALHEQLGFGFDTYDFSIPGVDFAGGRGALFKLTLAQSHRPGNSARRA